MNVSIYLSSPPPPACSPNVSRPCSPKSDSELITKAGEEKQQNPAMLWAWGELPQVMTPDQNTHTHAHRSITLHVRLMA